MNPRLDLLHPYPFERLRELLAGATPPANLRPVARGNVVHMNGGEGILTYGTRGAQPSGEALVERNVVFDNWSVNIYFDNQPGNVARDNFVFNHPTVWPPPLIHSVRLASSANMR